MLTHLKNHWWKYLVAVAVLSGLYWYWVKMYKTPTPGKQTQLEKAAETDSH